MILSRRSQSNQRHKARFLLLAVVLLCGLPGISSAQNIGFRVGESVRHFLARMDSLHVETWYDTANSFIDLKPTVSSANMDAASTQIFVEGDRTNELSFYFDRPFDSIYAHYAARLGPPVNEGYAEDDSTYHVVFRDSAFDYDLTNDSLVTVGAHDSTIPDVRQWALLYEDDIAQSLIDTTFGYRRFLPIKRLVTDTASASLFGGLLDWKYPHIGYETYGYSLILYEIDCDRHLLITRSRVDYTRDDRFIRYEGHPDKKWWKPDADNGLNAVIDGMCN